MASGRKESEKAIRAALDSFYSQFPKSTLGMSYFFDGQLQEAEDTFKSLLDFCEKRRVSVLSVLSNMFLSTIIIANGDMNRGFRRFKETQEIMLKNYMKVAYASSESLLGVVYTQLITGSSPGLSTLAKNIGFIAKTAPFADRKAKEHFNKAIEIFKDVGAKVYLGQAFFYLGRLHKVKKRNEKASECFSVAVHLFQESDAPVYLKQAQEELVSVE